MSRFVDVVFRNNNCIKTQIKEATFYCNTQNNINVQFFRNGECYFQNGYLEKLTENLPSITRRDPLEKKKKIILNSY